MASEGEKGRPDKREKAACGFRWVDGSVEKVVNVCRGRKNECEPAERRNSPTPK